MLQVSVTQARLGGSQGTMKGVGRVWKEAEEGLADGNFKDNVREKVHPKQGQAGREQERRVQASRLEHSASLTSQLPPERRHKVERT